jgi:hypothetical protein
MTPEKLENAISRILKKRRLVPDDGTVSEAFRLAFVLRPRQALEFYWSRSRRSFFTIRNPSYLFQCPSRISKLCLLRFALLGEIELMDCVGGHVPQDRAVAIAIASMAKT